MPSPRKPEGERAVQFGLSMPARLLRQIDAFEPTPNRRSEFIAEMVRLGLEHRYGPGWERIADLMDRIEAPEAVPA